MAVALLDASLVAMLAIVTISDLRSRIIPDRVLATAVLIALPICALVAPDSFRRACSRRRAPVASSSRPPSPGRTGWVSAT